MVNFGTLAAEILSLVWGTPGNFNAFRILAALLHGTLVLGVSQTGALIRGRYLYSAGRPSRWALAHILVFLFFLLSYPFPFLPVFPSSPVQKKQNSGYIQILLVLQRLRVPAYGF